MCEVLAHRSRVVDTFAMRLAIDTVGARLGGTAMVMRDIVAAATRIPGVEHITVFATAKPARQFEFASDPKLKVVDISGFAAGNLGRIPWQLRQLGKKAIDLDVDLVIGLANGGAAYADLPSAVYLQQALPFQPDVLASQPLAVQTRMRFARYAMKASAERARVVGVPTVAMKDAVVQAFGLPPQKVHVFMPAAPEFPDAAVAGTGSRAIATVPRGKRILYVGSDRPYKNMELAVAATTLIGGTLFTTAHNLGGLPNVVELADLTRSELRAAYETCDALVMPSRAESVSLPLLEAMRLGLPIVAVDKPYAREACRQAAIFVDESPRAMADGLRRVLGDGALRNEVTEKGLKRVAALDRDRPYDNMLRTFLRDAGFGRIV